MKIESFKATKVWGFMEFDIKFDKSLNFLIGINGSGKTTVMRLLVGLLSSSLESILQIDFSFVEVVCLKEKDNKLKRIIVSCEKTKQSIKFKFIENGNKEEYIIPLNRVQQLKIRDRDSFKNIEMQFDDSTFKAALRRNINIPLFLGLNRLVEKSSIILQESFSIRFRSSEKARENNIDKALREVQDLVYREIRENAKKQIQISQQFKNNIIDDSIDTDFFLDSQENKKSEYEDEYQSLSSRKQNLLKTFKHLEKATLSSKVDEYFENLHRILSILTNRPIKALENENPADLRLYALVSWLTAKNQLKKIDKMAHHAKVYEDSLKKNKEPLNRFIESVNLFFSEGNKQMIIDELGEIKIKKLQTTKIASMGALSSGEKQLIIMFAHLALTNKHDDSEIFIIDEPELSLHISWQEQFVDALLKANPNKQYILATHAPSIISHLGNRKYCIDLTSEK